ncbi:Multidrug resistance protein 3 [Tolypocladium capitatum]|uniref:Multidrug resistance protein 3 n=1 Tax=Tolypocladium capitatum TaxID=45235 RepID=A0A2K3QBJ3_9HYPO|nr:Multidrug resistance protein 3 [Tolypocladium capitatum]
MEKSGAPGVRPDDGPLTGIDGTSTSDCIVRGTTVPPWRFWLLSVGVCLGLFLSMVDSSIVATSLYTIGAEFQSMDSVNWVALAYTLAYLGCAVTFARLSDVIGRCNAFVTAYVVFFAFSLACGFSQDLPQLIAFRALQGIGGSGGHTSLFSPGGRVTASVNSAVVGLYSLSMIILLELCPSGLRQYIGSIVGLVIAGSGVLGPVLGGVLTHYASWRWVFWINGPIGFISLSIFVITWPKAEQLPPAQRRSWKEFDYIGSALVIAASVLVVFAFQNAGEASYNVWGNAVFIAPLVAGAIGWAALVAWEYMAESRFGGGFSPAFPIGLFRNRAYAAGAASTLFLGYPYLLLLYSFPLRAQVVSGKSALAAGIMLLPMLGASAVGSAISGKVNAKRDLLCETLAVGACLMTLGCGLLTTVADAGDDSKALGFITFAGLGFGLSVAAATILGILAQLRVLGGSFGISTSTVFMHIETNRYLAGVLTAHERMTLGKEGSDLSNEQWEAVHVAYSEAFRKGMVAATVFSGAAIVLTLGGYRRDRRGVEEQRRALMLADEPNAAPQSSMMERDSGDGV